MPLKTSLQWRNTLKSKTLISQLSSLLIQRKNAIQIIKSNRNLLPNPFNNNILIKILAKIKSQPQIALKFFEFAQSNLAVQPDLNCISKLTQILVDSGLEDGARSILRPALQNFTSRAVFESVVDAGAVSNVDEDSVSRVLGFVVVCYFETGDLSGGLEIFVKMVSLGCGISELTCNAVLDAVCSSSGDVGIAWCCYSAAIRRGCVANCRTWSILIKLICLEGKLGRAASMLDLGVFGVSSYELVIDCYCKRGEFDVVIGLLRRMCNLNVKPTFTTYSCVLNGGCRYGDDWVVRLMLRELVVQGFLWTSPCLDYDWVIKQLCGLGWSYAADMFFQRARDEDVELGSSIYDVMLKALLKDERGQEAIELYVSMLQKQIEVNSGSCSLLLSHICNEVPSFERNKVLKNAIGRGFTPNASDLSKYIASQCHRAYWEEATDLLHVAFEKEILLDPYAYDSLIKHYFTNKAVNMAFTLHERIKKLDGCLSLSSYHLLLKALFRGGKHEEAIQVFDHMKENNVLNSSVFVVMISELCQVKEMRKAMNLHDEMLKLGHKPDDKSYKRLISWFSMKDMAKH